MLNCQTSISATSVVCVQRVEILQIVNLYIITTVDNWIDLTLQCKIAAN